MLRYERGMLNKLSKHQNFYKTKTSTDIITFDTETTTYNRELSVTYIWMACINGECVYGRTPQECYDFFQDLKAMKSTFYVLVHNLGFDFCYLSSILKFEDKNIFAIKKHKVIEAIWENVVFRCTLAISNMGLDKLCKLYDLPVKKLTMDYSKLRHYDTPLTDDELAYCAVDVKALYYYAKIMLDKWGSYDNWRKTFTGFSRLQLANYQDMWSRHPDDESSTLPKKSTLMKNYADALITDPNMLVDIKHSYGGAHIYVQPEAVGKIFCRDEGYNIYKADFHSAYPSGLCTNKFPKTLYKVNYSTEDLIKELEKGDSLFFVYALFDKITLNTAVNIPCILKRRIMECYGEMEVEDGKVYSATKVGMWLNNDDWYNINQHYNVKVKKFEKAYMANKSYQSLPLIMMMRDGYQNKTNAETPQEREYWKLTINALSGAIAYFSKPEVSYHDGTWDYDDELEFDLTDLANRTKCKTQVQRNRKHPSSKLLEKDNLDYTLFQHAPYITSGTRRDLLAIDRALGYDNLLYNDADSAIFLTFGAEDDKRCKKVLTDYDEAFDRKLQKMCDYYNAKYDLALSLDDFMPKDKDSALGHCPIEAEYYMFKPLGQKRYLTAEDVTVDGITYYKVTATVSGCSKKGTRDFLLKDAPYTKSIEVGGDKYYNFTKETLYDIFENFNDDLIIPPEYSGVNKIYYTKSSEEPVEITDYLNNTITIKPTRGASLIPKSFSFHSIISGIEYLAGFYNTGISQDHGNPFSN